MAVVVCVIADHRVRGIVQARGEVRVDGCDLGIDFVLERAQLIGAGDYVAAVERRGCGSK